MSPRVHPGWAAAVAAALVLAGCSAADEPAAPTGTAAPASDQGVDARADPDQGTDAPNDAPNQDQDQDLARTPDPDQEPLPVVDPEGVRLPESMLGRVVVQGPWDVLPQERGGTFLAPQEREGALDFTAVDGQGSVLWMAQRPASCAGFTVTSTEGQDLAVLTDLTTTEESLAETTASAYDLHTGEQVWGPVPVHGPHVGPGLTFSAPGDGPIGDMGAKVVLDASTGHIVAEEVQDGVRILDAADDGGGEVLAQYDDARILGEYDGVVLLADGAEVVALDAAQAQEQWRLTEEYWEGAALAPAAGARPGEPLARLQVAPQRQAAVVLADGSVLADDVTDAGTEGVTGTHVVVEQDHIRGYDADGAELWAYALTGPTRITGLGGVMAYLRTGDAVRVHNVLTGEVAQAYDPEAEGQILVPAAISAEGAGVVVAEDGYRLVTITSDGTKE